MKKIHIIFMKETINPEDLVLYVSRYKSKKHAIVTMHLQGLLPQHEITYHKELPTMKYLIGVMLPHLGVIRNQYKKVTLITLLKYWLLPIRKLFFGSSTKDYKKVGSYDTLTKRVYTDE